LLFKDIVQFLLLHLWLPMAIMLQVENGQWTVTA